MPWYVVSLVDCYTQKGWLETQMNLPTVEGLEPPKKEYIPGPTTSVTQFTVPITATDPDNRTFVQDQSIQTSDLELAHAQHYQRASEGETWAHFGWDAERVKNLLQDRNYGLSIDEVNLAHPSLATWRALPRSSSQHVGIGFFLLCFPDWYGSLQESVGYGRRTRYAAAWDFAFKGEGFRHC